MPSPRSRTRPRSRWCSPWKCSSTLRGRQDQEGGEHRRDEPPAEVEGANADVTPYLQEQWDAGKGGFGAIYSMLGKPLPEAPAEEAAAAPAEEAPAAE